MSDANRLLWHAGLSDARFAGVTIADAAGHDDPGSLGPAVQDFLDTLARFSHELNHAAPSDITGGAPHIRRDVVYAVAEVMRLLRGSSDDGWAVETAWLAVLAGDVDDLHEHLALERRHRKVSPAVAIVRRGEQELTVEAVVPSWKAAVAETERLNALNPDEPPTYSCQPTRLVGLEWPGGTTGDS